MDKVTSLDCKNHLAKGRKNNIGRQCMQVFDFFQRKAGVEDGFFFKMEVDENNQVRSIFWANKRSRMAYMQFGDVVVFDVTYNTNSFKMPFAPFTGVNHHRQSTLFGCALLADEKTDTFTWLFETWLECMWGKRPQGIITDQDLAMRNAIAKVFPGTKHRFCSWHIGMKANMHLNHFGQHPEFIEDYNNWRFVETVEESEINWEEMKVKYGIKEGNWLNEMYEVCSQWISAYLKDYFFSGMTSSQRSESINAFFDGYVNAQTPISEFVQQYDNAICQRRDEEAYEDHKSLHSKPTMHVGSTMEEQARSLYTRKVFSLFQAELKESLLYKYKQIGCEGSRNLYEVKKNMAAEKCHKVTFENISPISIECTCKKFESEGILCRHILRILDRMDIDIILEKYILFRWTINARYTSVANLRTMREIHESGVTPYMIYCIRSVIYKISDLSSISPQHWKLAMPKLEVIVEELDRLSLLSNSEEYRNVETGDVGGSMEANEYLPHIVLKDPSKVKSKGRPRTSKRFKPSLEISLSSQIKKHKCSLCHQLGHYMNTCSLYKVTQGGQTPMPLQVDTRSFTSFPPRK